MYLFALTVTLIVTSCGQKKGEDIPLVRPVKTATVSSQSVILKDFSGMVEAVEYVKLAFRVSGQIIDLPVVEGQRVRKGQLIAAIDPGIFPCNMPPTRLPMKPLPPRWSATNGCWAAKPSPCRSMK